MDIRLGYKRTEVGLIPKDWKIVSVGQLLLSPPSYGVNAPAVPYDSRLPTYLRITDITKNGKFSEVSKVSVEHPATELYALEPGDLVVARTGASVGKSYLYDSEDGRLVYAGFLIRLSPDPERLVSKFLSFYANTSSYWSWVKVNSMRSGQPGINGREYAILPIPLPPTLAEQEAIAEALSDADALIESLEQLITKKRQIKKGAMQELLTGKKRLPGFSGEWNVKRLGEISAIAMGRTPSRNNTAFWGRGHIWLSIADLHSKIVEDSREQITDLAAAGMPCVPKGTLLMSFKLSIGRLCFAGCDLFTNEAICSFLNLKVNADYLYYALCRIDFSIYGKQAVKGYTLNSESLKMVEVSLPEPPEQIAIATILSDMDAEIAALEAKLSKARLLKQGMMQELLTGRIRLV